MAKGKKTKVLSYVPAVQASAVQAFSGLEAHEARFCQLVLDGIKPERAFGIVQNEFSSGIPVTLDAFTTNDRIALAIYGELNARLMQRGAPAAVKFLEDLVTDEDADRRLRLQAANSILDRVGLTGPTGAKGAEPPAPATLKSVGQALGLAMAELHKRGLIATTIKQSPKQASDFY